MIFVACNKKKILIILISVLFVSMLVRYMLRVPKRHYCDFRVYHHTAQLFLEGKDIYTRDLEEVTPFKYSPFFAFLISPLGLLPIKSAAALFFTINFLSTMALLIFARKICADEQDFLKAGGLIYFFGALFSSRFIFLAWDSGQVGIIMCALVAASLYFFSKGKDIAAAALLAVSILIKYMPALLIPYFIFRKKFKAAALTVSFIILWLILPSLFIGIQKNTEYIVSWMPSITSTSLDNGSYFDTSNQSILSFILRLTNLLPNNTLAGLDLHRYFWVAYALSFLLYILVLLPGKRKDAVKIDYALIFVYLSLFNPNAWMHNFVSLIFPYIFFICYLVKARFKDRFVLVCIILSFILSSWFSRSLVGNKLELFSEQFSFVAIGAFFLIAALIKLKFLTKYSDISSRTQ